MPGLAGMSICFQAGHCVAASLIHFFYLTNQEILTQCPELEKVFGWMDDRQLTSFSTVFQSYQDDGRVIMKGCEKEPHCGGGGGGVELMGFGVPSNLGYNFVGEYRQEDPNITKYIYINKIYYVMHFNFLTLVRNKHARSKKNVQNVAVDIRWFSCMSEMQIALQNSEANILNPRTL